MRPQVGFKVYPAVIRRGCASAESGGQIGFMAYALEHQARHHALAWVVGHNQGPHVGPPHRTQQGLHFGCIHVGWHAAFHEARGRIDHAFDNFDADFAVDECQQFDIASAGELFLAWAIAALASHGTGYPGDVADAAGFLECCFTGCARSANVA